MTTRRAREPDAVLPPEGEDAAALKRRIEAFASFLDDGMEIPGLGIRFGWDAILGFIPGIGDLITLVLSLYLIGEAYRAGAPGSVLARMLANIAADSAIGSIPVAGDVFDIGFKSNRRNSRILLEWIDRPIEVQRRSRIGVALGIAAIVLAVVAVLAISIAAAIWLVRQLSIAP